MIPVRYRPIEIWPGKLRSDDERTYSPFDASWSQTADLLDREAHMLRAPEIVLQLAVPESAIRVDGGLRGDRRPPDHPGVIVSLETRDHGPLRYACDAYRARGYSGMRDSWRHNVRAIALGLEALRKVERYGIAQRGEQYQGWKAIGTGVAMGARPEPMTVEEAALLIAGGSETWDAVDLIADRPATGGIGAAIREAFRDAAKLLHPDTNPDPAATEKMKRLGEARDLLLAR